MFKLSLVKTNTKMLAAMLLLVCLTLGCGKKGPSDAEVLAQSRTELDAKSARIVAENKKKIEAAVAETKKKQEEAAAETKARVSQLEAKSVKDRAAVEAAIAANRQKAASAQSNPAPQAAEIENAVINGRVADVRKYIDSGIDVKGWRQLGETLLHKASASDQKEIVNLLLRCDCDPTVKNNEGRKPAEIAGSAEVQAILKNAEKLISSEIVQKNNLEYEERMGFAKRPDASTFGATGTIGATAADQIKSKYGDESKWSDQGQRKAMEAAKQLSIGQIKTTEPSSK